MRIQSLPMDFAAILKQSVPTIVSLLASISSNWKTDAPPPPLPLPPLPAGAAEIPSEAIKHLQTLLNSIVKPIPPPNVDGWLGPKTEQAIEDGVAMLKGYGIE